MPWSRRPLSSLPTLQAGDQSEYVGTFRAVLLNCGGRLGPAMPPNYFRFFCDKLLRSFAPRYYENVFRCRKISDIGCQQVGQEKGPGSAAWGARASCRWEPVGSLKALVASHELKRAFPAGFVFPGPTLGRSTRAQTPSLAHAGPVDTLCDP